MFWCDGKGGNSVSWCCGCIYPCAWSGLLSAECGIYKWFRRGGYLLLGIRGWRFFCRKGPCSYLWQESYRWWYCLHGKTGCHFRWILQGFRILRYSGSPLYRGGIYCWDCDRLPSLWNNSKQSFYWSWLLWMGFRGRNTRVELPWRCFNPHLREYHRYNTDLSINTYCS